jgi:response regulator RpfG family c-di-GMP phosphodiesterase
MSSSNLNENDSTEFVTGFKDSGKLFISSAWEYHQSENHWLKCTADKKKIITCEMSGWSTKSDYTKLGTIIDDIISAMGWEGKSWVLIYECSRLAGMDIAARGKLLDLLLSQNNLKCVIVNSPSHLVKSLVQLAVTFYSPPFDLIVCNDIWESYRKAGVCLGLVKDDLPHNAVTEKIVLDTGKKNNKDIDAVLQILGDVEWNKSGVKFLEDMAQFSPWKPFLSMMAIIKGDLDIMLQKREERLSELEKRNHEEITLQQKMSQALEVSLKAKANFEQESRRNIMLTRVVVDTQKEILFSMGEIIESRSRETANHIRRVAEYSTLLAKLFDLSEREQQHLLHTSPMHDAGKIAIPDAILNKPGKLTDDEFVIMKDHTRIGWEMLRGSQLEIMQFAAIIAYQHHEKWNGKGYPSGLKGDEIHIFGRIVALADVFDALGSDRCYKKAWSLDRILELLHKESGEHFDPVLTDLFFRNIDDFLAIRERFPDAAP